MTAPTLLPRDDDKAESASASPQTPSLAHQSIEDSHSVVRNSLIAGSVAGVASTLACHPFDVIRTKMQSASMGTTASSSTASTISSSSRPRTATAGPLQVISQTLKNGGLRALYTGLALPLAAQAVYKATIFTVNNVTQETLLDWHNHHHHSSNNKSSTSDDEYSLTLSDHFICGFVAGGVNAALFVTPVEYVRNQLIRQHSLQVAGQAVSQNYTGPLDVVRSTIRRSSSPLGLWKGVGVTVARDSIGVAFFFGSMQWCQQYIAKQRPAQSHHQKPSLSVTIVSGAVAGLAYWVIALPLDSVKTWVQSDMADSAVQAVKTSLQQQGLRQTLVNLFAGFQVAYARGIPSAAITVATYSLCYQTLQDMDGVNGVV